MQRRRWSNPAIAIAVLAAVGLVAGARLLFHYWPGQFFDGLTSGVWTGLAWDAAHGNFYRPLLSDAGYGGTRYMPLFFLGHAALIRAHLDPVYAGVWMMQASVIAAAGSVFLALRSFGVHRRLAMALAGTVWATIVYQKYATDVHGDYLAAALAMAALGLAHDGRERWAWIGSAIAIVLAFFTKLTAIGFAVPIAISLVVAGRRAVAIRFMVLTTALSVIVFFIVETASSGHFLENMRATATGGMSPRDVLQAVPTLARELAQEPFVTVPLALAAWAILRSRPRWHGASLYLIAATAITAAIFASPGTASNHLVDLQMASAVAVGVALQQGDLPSMPAAAAYGVLAVLLAAISWPMPGIPSVIGSLDAHGPRSRATVYALHSQFVTPSAPYLSFDPIVPILNGDRPLMLDWFSLRRFVEEHTPVGRDLTMRVERREFRAIVLRENDGLDRDVSAGEPGFEEFQALYWTRNDNALTRLFRTTYDMKAVRRPFVILLPKPSSHSSLP